MDQSALLDDLDRQIFDQLHATLVSRSADESEVPRAGFGHGEAEALSANCSAIDLEELLGYMDGAELLLFGDARAVPACREYVAAYLASSRPGAPPILALDAFDAGAVARASHRWELMGGDESAFMAFVAELEQSIEGAMPGGYIDLLRIALARGIPIHGLAVADCDPAHRCARMASRLRIATRQRAVVALLDSACIAPHLVEKHFLKDPTHETVVVYQSPPELHWHLRERMALEDIPAIVHLRGTWAFATLATHPIFFPAGELARIEDDILLPPRPAHSERRIDAPMIEMLFGASELLRDIVNPSVPTPDATRVVTFLEPDLPAHLENLSIPLPDRELILDAAAQARCVALPEHNLVYVGRPCLSPAIESLYQVLLETRHRAGRGRGAAFARRTACEALAFFSSCLVAGRRLWPCLEPSDEPAIDLARRILVKLERALEREEPLETRGVRLLSSGTDEALDADAAWRLGRFIGGLLITGADAQQIDFDAITALFDDDWSREHPLRWLLSIAQVAMA